MYDINKSSICQCFMLNDGLINTEAQFTYSEQ